MADIYKDTKAVKLLADYSNGKKNVEGLNELDSLIKDLAQNPNPQNKYMLAQLIGFTVNELMKPATNWLDIAADTKRVGLGEKAVFRAPFSRIEAVIQAKNSTTRRTRIDSKSFSVDTVEVSARPVVNLAALQGGLVNMGELVNAAKTEISNKVNAYVENVLLKSAKTLATPYYATGAGIIKNTFDPIVRHWMRYGGAVIIGDIAAISKLTEQTGFTSATNTQYADGLLLEHNNNGYIGKYLGADVICLVNPYNADGMNTVMTEGNIYVLPKAATADMRSLKVALEGDVQSLESTNIDDKSYEIRLDQYVGAGLVSGESPLISVYNDSSING